MPCEEPVGGRILSETVEAFKQLISDKHIKYTEAELGGSSRNSNGGLRHDLRAKPLKSGVTVQINLKMRTKCRSQTITCSWAFSSAFAALSELLFAVFPAILVVALPTAVKDFWTCSTRLTTTSTVRLQGSKFNAFRAVKISAASEDGSRRRTGHRLDCRDAWMMRRDQTKPNGDKRRENQWWCPQEPRFSNECVTRARLPATHVHVQTAGFVDVIPPAMEK
ncbi:hypothetical protein B0H14DRAFT_2576029 [Mycena olivaceomarginata]|nr:hypothetical protein B0H14DRAFT_2576029 [Mycena olivaceomarginata]